jgi:hypothetical protein
VISSVEHMWHFICLKCRRSVKGIEHDGTLYSAQRINLIHPKKCSHCGGEMPCVGKHFTPPRRNDEKQWKKLEWMIAQGWRGDSWTTPSSSLREVKEAAPPRIDPDTNRLRAWERHRAMQKQLQKVERHIVHRMRRKKLKAAKEWQRQLEYQERVLKSKND